MYLEAFHSTFLTIFNVNWEEKSQSKYVHEDTVSSFLWIFHKITLNEFNEVAWSSSLLAAFSLGFIIIFSSYYLNER